MFRLALDYFKIAPYRHISSTILVSLGSLFAYDAAEYFSQGKIDQGFVLTAFSLVYFAPAALLERSVFRKYKGKKDITEIEILFPQVRVFTKEISRKQNIGRISKIRRHFPFSLSAFSLQACKSQLSPSRQLYISILMFQ